MNKQLLILFILILQIFEQKDTYWHLKFSKINVFLLCTLQNFYFESLKNKIIVLSFQQGRLCIYKKLFISLVQLIQIEQSKNQILLKIFVNQQINTIKILSKISKSIKKLSQNQKSYLIFIDLFIYLLFLNLNLQLWINQFFSNQNTKIQLKSSILKKSILKKWKIKKKIKIFNKLYLKNKCHKYNINIKKMQNKLKNNQYYLNKFVSIKICLNFIKNINQNIFKFYQKYQINKQQIKIYWILLLKIVYYKQNDKFCCVVSFFQEYNYLQVSYLLHKFYCFVLTQI
ncbi:transmembrane protein, putative (macronuclear) [Tetrahymena thermophila SB210]|uniref:Transmembrane protein, putative n=1 Tax=Tetrahymena thermophila (strain SB210) TaxID=312017 RepID=W7XEL4_TETTS|nr:transmembrane protein, putative [Tetrahymena thermophila SB210]EWS72316.1 transmembrane protein, putative [Tetrahymena thermophila SB210]|eukprot:XP_012655150.1 transmembrane protein, putative [Tetrahymena thermophila SB210]